jgi:endoglucanase
MASLFFRGHRSRLFLAFLIFPLTYSGAVFAQGVAHSPLRNLTKRQIVWDMKVGWNLGNTMDASPNETSWGNPVTTQAMIDAVKAMGFKTVRVPVSWTGHFGGGPNYTIDAAWLNRVDTIVNYVLRDSMYVILNSHHDSSSFPLLAPDSAASRARIAALWTQIANRFRDYSDYLIFETLNEPRGPVNMWDGGNAQQRGILNAYHFAAVNAIRATGGNNARRFIMCCTHSACPLTVAINGLVIPNNDTNVLVSIHTYYPFLFCFPRRDGGTVSVWGSSADSEEVRSELDRELFDVTAKGSVAVIGEWGSVNKNNLSSRVAHACYYAQQARQRGMLPVWWDNGATDSLGFGILNRRSNPVSWYFPTIAQALCNCAANVTAVEDGYRPPSKNSIPADNLTLRGGVLRYSLPGAARVSLRVISLQGRTAALLVNAAQRPGIHEVKLQGGKIPSGSYILELQAGDVIKTQKVFLF